MWAARSRSLRTPGIQFSNTNDLLLEHLRRRAYVKKIIDHSIIYIAVNTPNLIHYLERFYENKKRARERTHYLH